MKNTLYILSICLLFITACSKDDVYQEEVSLKTSKESVLLDNSKTYEIVDIINAQGKYYAYASNNEIVEVKTEDEKLIIIAVKPGETTIIVSDSTAQQAEIKVTVEKLERPKSKIEVIYVKKSETRIINFPYSSESGYRLMPDQYSHIIETTESLPNSLRVEGKELGRTLFAVQKDYWNEHYYDIRVEENYPLTGLVSKYSTSPKTGKITFAIMMGNGGYEVKSSDSSITKGRIVKYPIGWDKTNSNFNEAGSEVETFGKPGTAILTITDAAGISKKIEVEVREQN